MAERTTKPLKPSILADDRDSLAALKGMQDYAPANPGQPQRSLASFRKVIDLPHIRRHSRKAKFYQSELRDELVIVCV
jgi:hypothetical protein